MKRFLLAQAIPAALFAQGGCIDNSNQVGTVDPGESGGSPVVVGGRGGGTEAGGAGNAPGAMGGKIGAGPPVIAKCTPTGATLVLPRECSSAADCLAVAQTKTVLLSDEPEATCEIRYVGIEVAAEPALTTFKADCQAVGACAADETVVVTQDGKSGPLLSSTPLATCRNSMCQSYLP